MNNFRIVSQLLPTVAEITATGPKQRTNKIILEELNFWGFFGELMRKRGRILRKYVSCMYFFQAREVVHITAHNSTLKLVFKSVPETVRFCIKNLIIRQGGNWQKGMETRNSELIAE